MTRLSGTVERLTGKIGTDEFFVLREGAPVSNGRGGTTKGVPEATTEEPIPCFYAIVPPMTPLMQKLVAERKVALVFRRFVCGASVGVTTEDRLRLVAREPVPEIEMEVIRATPISGLVMEIITVEEQQ